MKTGGFATLMALLVLTLSGCVDDSDANQPEASIEAPPEPLPAGAGLAHGVDGAIVTMPGIISTGASIATGFRSFEPTIGVTSSGALFMSNSEGAIATGHSSIVRSIDGGATWHDITPNIGGISTPPTSTDPYIFVDQDTDRVYNLDMEGLNCNYIQWSDDDGESFTGHPFGCGAPPVLDHPSLFTAKPRLGQTVGYDNVVYICVNRVADAACAMSFDGGVVFTPFRSVFPEIPPSEGGATGSCGGLSAHGIGGPEGRAYLGRVHCSIPYVSYTEDDGLTWTSRAVSNDFTGGGHDVEVAVDTAGNVYALWRDQNWDLRLAASTDHGYSWGPAHNVSAPGVNTAVFPAIAAGDDGRVAFTYYGTGSMLSQSEMTNEVEWTAYLATIQNATDLEPVIVSTTLSDHPIATGACDDDNRCRGVGDFVDIVIDQYGRPWAGLVDSCPGDVIGECNGAVTGFLGTLRTGPTLRGQPGALPEMTAF